MHRNFFILQFANFLVLLIVILLGQLVEFCLLGSKTRPRTFSHLSLQAIALAIPALFNSMIAFVFWLGLCARRRRLIKLLERPQFWGLQLVYLFPLLIITVDGVVNNTRAIDIAQVVKSVWIFATFVGIWVLIDWRANQKMP